MASRSPKGWGRLTVGLDPALSPGPGLPGATRPSPTPRGLPVALLSRVLAGPCGPPRWSRSRDLCSFAPWVVPPLVPGVGSRWGEGAASRCGAGGDGDGGCAVCAGLRDSDVVTMAPMVRVAVAV